MQDLIILRISARVKIIKNCFILVFGDHACLGQDSGRGKEFHAFKNYNKIKILYEQNSLANER